MSTHSVSTDALTLIIGRPWSLPMRWQDPASGAAIDTTGWGIAAVLSSEVGLQADLVPALTDRDDAGGVWTFVLTDDQTALVAEGQVSKLKITLTEPGGADTHDSDWPIDGVLP